MTMCKNFVFLKCCLTFYETKNINICTITSNINVIPKGVRSSEKMQLLQHSVMKFDISKNLTYVIMSKLIRCRAKIECSFEMGK